MIAKYYTCDMLDKHNVVVGSGFVRVWFFNSPETAYDMIIRNKPAGYDIIRFRRVK